MNSKPELKKDYAKEEYEIQLFKFSINQLKLEHRLLVKHELKNSINEFTKKMIAKLGNRTPVIGEIQLVAKDVIANIFDSLETDLKEFDHIIDKYFEIPDNVIAPEDALHAEYNAETEKQLIEDVEDMEKIFLQNQVMATAMESEIEEYESISHIIENEIKISSVLEKKFKDIYDMYSNYN